MLENIENASKIPLDPPCLPVGRLFQRGMKEEDERRKQCDRIR
jgi:hypothetical protein